jgi:hypothetical protein
MKKVTLISLIFSLVLLSGCAFYIPYDFEDNLDSYRIVFLVEPDSAEILLNGRFIGEAYEFATPDSALILYSRDSRIVVRKKGYQETPVDLMEYDTRNITVRLRLRKTDSSAPPPPKAVESKIPPSSKRPEYAAKKEKVKTEPEVKPADAVAVKYTTLIINIKPADSSIYLNGKFFGVTPTDGQIKNMRLKSGKYLLEVVKPGFKTFRKMLNLTGQKSIKLDIILKKS